MLNLKFRRLLKHVHVNKTHKYDIKKPRVTFLVVKDIEQTLLLYILKSTVFLDCLDSLVRAILQVVSCKQAKWCSLF